MAIPSNICEEDVVKAIHEADREPWSSSRNARCHQLFYEGKLYPVKYIISLASKYAGYGELPYSEFISTESRIKLQKLGFKIVSQSLPDMFSQAQAATQADKLIPVRNPSKALTDENAVPTDWFWEGNVAKGIAKHLEQDGWTLNSIADTFSKERGVDIKASKNCQTFLVEVKGYPSTSYRDPKRSKDKKPTNPSNQAQHWYSHALLKALRLQTEYPDAIVAIGLPDFPRYRKLFEETKPGLEKLGVIICMFSENGNVIELGSSRIM